MPRRDNQRRIELSNLVFEPIDKGHERIEAELKQVRCGGSLGPEEIGFRANYGDGLAERAVPGTIYRSALQSLRLTIRFRFAPRTPLQQPLDVFRQNVELEVNESAGLRLFQIRMHPRVRNNPSDETLGQHFSGCQADSVNSDGAFCDDVARELHRQLDLKSIVSALLCKVDNARGAINVALHEMSPQGVSRGEGTLKVHTMIRAKMPEICALESFIEKIECKLSVFAGANSETAAVYGHADPEGRVR